METEQELRDRVAKQARRMREAERDRPTLLAQTVYLGTLAVLFVLPVVLGAYLGSWLDGHMEGYSVRWTVSLILIGVFVGAVDVYLFIRERH
jgi:ATP synthase protein I